MVSPRIDFDHNHCRLPNYSHLDRQRLKSTLYRNTIMGYKTTLLPPTPRLTIIERKIGAGRGFWLQFTGPYRRSRLRRRCPFNEGRSEGDSVSLKPIAGLFRPAA